jgi:hypothetical protein
LKDMPQLTQVGLMETQVTDAGLIHLKNLRNLTALALEKTKVSEAAKADLKAALPKCGIGGRWYQY